MKVLLAIDDSSCSEAAIGKVLHHDHRSELEVLVLHVIDPCQLTPAPLMFGEGSSTARQLISLRLKWHEGANMLVTRTAERLEAAGIKASTLVREGEPRAIILEQATQWQADLIVLGSHGRSGMNRFLLGSVSHTVARHSLCSTLIVRAPGEGESSLSPDESQQTMHTSHH